VVLGHRQMNTFRKIPLPVIRFRWRHFVSPSMSVIYICDYNVHVMLVDIWSMWVNGSETTAYTAKDNDVIVADISHKVIFTHLEAGCLKVLPASRL
jgi:hypothetical protein